MKLITEIMFYLLCGFTLFTVWAIHHRCREMVRTTGTRFEKLRTNGQFVTRWLFTFWALIGLVWGRTHYSVILLYFTIFMYLLTLYRYYKCGGWLEKQLTKLNW